MLCEYQWLGYLRVCWAWPVLNVLRLKAQQGADRGFHIAGVVLILVTGSLCPCGVSVWLNDVGCVPLVHPHCSSQIDLTCRSENIRAYISRSFTNPMWHDILGNKHMQKAIVMAQICLYVVPCMKLVHGTLDLGNCTADFCRILTAEGFQMPSVLAAECRARG